MHHVHLHLNRLSIDLRRLCLILLLFRLLSLCLSDVHHRRCEVLLLTKLAKERLIPVLPLARLHMRYVIRILRRLLLLFVDIAIDGVSSHCHFFHALGRVGGVKVIVGLALLPLGGLRGEHDVLLTDLHGLGGTFAVGCGLLGRFDYVAACSLNGLLVRFGRERQAATWGALAVVGVEAWVAGWSGEAGRPFLVGKGLAVLARAHDVLRHIDQVALPVFLHRCAQLLGCAPVRL